MSRFVMKRRRADGDFDWGSAGMRCDAAEHGLLDRSS